MPAAASAAGHTGPAETEGRRGLGKNGPEESSLRWELPRAQIAPRGTAKGAWGALAGQGCGLRSGGEGPGTQNLRKGRRAI